MELGKFENMYVVDPNATDEQLDELGEKMKEMRSRGERTFLLTESGRIIEIED